jgi:hypothetical protein
MTTVQFYRAYVCAPLVFGGAALAAFSAGWEPTGVVAGSIAGPLATSVLFGGIPYAVLAVWATWWLGGKNERQILRLALRMPLLMIAIYAPWAMVYEGLINTIMDGASFAMWGAAYALLIGYAYVGLGIAIHAGLRGFSCITADPAT